MSWTRIGAGSLIGASVSGIAAVAASAYIPGAGELAGKVAEQAGISPQVAAGVIGAAAGALVGGVIVSFTGDGRDEPSRESEPSAMDNIGDTLKKAGVSVATEGVGRVLKPLSEEALAKIGGVAKASAGIA